MSEKTCPKINPKVKEYVKAGTLACYIAHTVILKCADVACCADCPQKDTCEIACKYLTPKNLPTYIK